MSDQSVSELKLSKTQKKWGKLFVTAAFFFLVTVIFINPGCVKNEEPRKVLLIPREGSLDLEYMLIHEVEVMTGLLENAGFEIVVATDSGEPLVSKSMIVKPDLRLADVEVTDYVGVIMPCMAAGIPGPVSQGAIEIVKETVAEGKPIAAQYGSVTILGEAGVLEGKKYAYKYDRFQEGHYMGYGVIQEGNIITSGTCPFAASYYGREDGTSVLTLKLIQSLNSK